MSITLAQDNTSAAPIGTEQFIHLNAKDIDLDTEDRDPGHYGGLTVAYRLYRTNPSSNGSIFVFAEYGLAVCDSRDRYVRKTGREIALKRLNELATTINTRLGGVNFLGYGRWDYDDRAPGKFIPIVPRRTADGEQVESFPQDFVILQDDYDLVSQIVSIAQQRYDDLVGHGVIFEQDNWTPQNLQPRR